MDRWVEKTFDSNMGYYCLHLVQVLQSYKFEGLGVQGRGSGLKYADQEVLQLKKTKKPFVL